MTYFKATKAGQVKLSADEIAELEEARSAAEADRDAAAAIAAQQALKLSGVEILGVMCSATKQDQNGMTAIGLATLLARSSGGILPQTEMKFENGNSLVITDANFNQVQAIWLPFRQSFFAAE